MDIILSPPIAFLIYLPLTYFIVLIGQAMAGKQKSSPEKSSTYGSGEAAPTNLAAPGYQPFFLIAFFFAILHLGILVLGTSAMSTPSIIFLAGMILGLIALILG